MWLCRKWLNLFENTPPGPMLDVLSTSFHYLDYEYARRGAFKGDLTSPRLVKTNHPVLPSFFFQSELAASPPVG
jgi:hypothetical protein